MERHLKQRHFYLYDLGVLTDIGRAFQAPAAATGNGQSARVVCCVLALLIKHQGGTQSEKIPLQQFLKLSLKTSVVHWLTQQTKINCPLNGCMCDTCKIRLAQQ